MLTGFSEDDLRIVAIDPGINTCGFAVLSISMETFEISILDAYTVKSNSFVTQNKMFAMIHGDKAAKLHGLEEHIHTLCERCEPYMVTSEAPFMGRFAAAFGALKEVTMVLRKGSYRYDFMMPFMFIEPTPVKKHMKVKGTSSDKNLMTVALSKRTDLVWADTIVFDNLDEHSVDAVSVGLYHVDRIREQLIKENKKH
ncbi:holliday junction resolvase [Vibrio phage vB_pir03]|nr:holliday junction resolvase [Vibrio phage vB_pir03]